MLEIILGPIIADSPKLQPIEKPKQDAGLLKKKLEREKAKQKGEQFYLTFFLN